LLSPYGAVKGSLQMLLIDQSEERILQTDQSKNALKHLLHHVNGTLKPTLQWP